MPKPPANSEFTADQLATIVKMTSPVSDKPLDQLAGVALYVINCFASAELANERELEKIAADQAKAAAKRAGQ